MTSGFLDVGFYVVSRHVLGFLAETELQFGDFQVKILI
jgi:hypothetical protein